MALRFKPVDNVFYALLTESATRLVEGADILAEMLGDPADRESIAKRMRDAEHEADETTHEIAKRVNSTFVTPFDREDIYALASGLDEYWIEINRLENAGDKSYRRILAKLFSGQYEALEVLKLKDVVDSLEHAVDAFEKVANIIEQIHAKES